MLGFQVSFQIVPAPLIQNPSTGNGGRVAVEAVALRMLEKGMSIAEICSITKLSRGVVNRLERESGESDSDKKQGRARKQA